MVLAGEAQGAGLKQPPQDHFAAGPCGLESLKGGLTTALRGPA